MDGAGVEGTCLAAVLEEKKKTPALALGAVRGWCRSSTAAGHGTGRRSERSLVCWSGDRWAYRTGASAGHGFGGRCRPTEGASVSGLGVAGLWLGSYEALHGLEGVRNAFYSWNTLSGACIFSSTCTLRHVTASHPVHTICVRVGAEPS